MNMSNHAPCVKDFICFETVVAASSSLSGELGNQAYMKSYCL